MSRSVAGRASGVRGARAWCQCPGQPGTLLERNGHRAEARAAYERALALDASLDVVRERLAGLDG